MVEGLPHHHQVEDWTLRNPSKVEASDGAKNRTELDILKLKGLVLRVTEEVFKSDNTEEFKLNLGVLIVVASNGYLKNEDFLAESLDHKEAAEVLMTEGKEDQLMVFLEEEWILSMLHKDQDGDSSPIGVFEPPLTLEGSRQSWPKVDPFQKCAEEEMLLLGSDGQDHSRLAFNSKIKELGLGDTTCSGPTCPPGFEEFFGLDGSSYRTQLKRRPLEIFGWEDPLGGEE